MEYEEKDIKKIIALLDRYDSNVIIEFFRDNIDYFLKTSERFLELTEDLEYVDKEKEHLTFLESLTIAKDFLESINEDYAKDLQTYIKNGTINTQNIIEVEEDENYSMGYYIVSNEDGNKEIQLLVENNISDVSTIIHEFIHAQSLNGIYTLDSLVLAESVPIMHEFALFNYLLNNNLYVEDSLNEIIWRIKSSKKYAKRILKGINIYKHIMKNHQLLNTHFNAEELDKIIEEENLITLVKRTINYFLGTILGLKILNNYLLKGIDLNLSLETFTKSIEKNNNLDSLDIFIDFLPNKEEVESGINYLKEKANSYNKKSSL